MDVGADPDGRRMPRRAGGRSRRVAAAAMVITAAGAASAGEFASGAGAAASSRTVIAVEQETFGPMLVVGSGKLAGYTLYMITSDSAGHFGCTAAVVKNLPGGPGSCTGSLTDRHAEWPALTTTGAPVAGTGATQSLLGTVHRAGIGNQVTYAGHPLYLFDGGPGQITGEGWDEPNLPPWHGVWWVLSPAGNPLPWAGTLTTTTIGSKQVLAEMMFTGAGWKPFPVYSYSTDSSSSSSCTAACAVAWPPVITSGTPGVTGTLSASNLATLSRADGTTQVTYKGQPLYLFSHEQIAKSATGFAATGNGAGVTVGSGTFSLVTP